MINVVDVNKFNFSGSKMKKAITALAVFLTTASVFVAVGSAKGFVLSNHDDEDYQIELIEKNKPANSFEIELFEGDEIYDLCEAGCFIRFAGNEYNFDGSEILAIEGGEIINLGPN